MQQGRELTQTIYAHEETIKWAQKEYKHINEIKNSMQNMKEEINKDTENLRSNQSEINNSIYQIKVSVES
jgi:hypothetical protein